MSLRKVKLRQACEIVETIAVLTVAAQGWPDGIQNLPAAQNSLAGQISIK
jgi:hypothetical protein